MEQYRELIDRILVNGIESEDRTKQGTIYKFGESIEFDLQDGFPIVTMREIDFKQAVGELIGFMRGYTKISEFKSVGCNYWDRFSNNDKLGPIYGKQWRDFGGIDQLNVLINMLKHNPTSRRLIMSFWNPPELNSMVLPPCPVLQQFNVQDDKLNCIVYARSIDTMLGLPYDIVVYALLTHILAQECGYNVGKLIFYIGNCHIYRPHIMEAIKLIKLPTFELPTLLLNDIKWHKKEPSDFELIGYTSGPKVKFELFV